MRKITQTPRPFSVEMEGVVLEGQVSRKACKLFCINGFLKGSLKVVCDVSGEDFVKKIEESLVLYISDGIWDVQSQSLRLDDFDVIEFFDGFIDMEYILQSEIQSIQMDYHIKE